MPNKKAKIPIGKRHLPVLLPLEGVERNANFLDKLLNNSCPQGSEHGYISGNPNPILGTEKEKELKIVRETRLIHIDQSVKQLEQCQTVTHSQVAQAQTHINISNLEPDLPVNNIQAGINYDVATLILPLKQTLQHQAEKQTYQNMHQRYLEFQKDKCQGTINYQYQHPKRDRRGDTIESVNSTKNAKRSEALASTSMLQRFENAGQNLKHKGIRSQDEKKSSNGSKQRPEQVKNDKQNKFTDYQSTSVNKKQSVPVLINKCSSKRINVDMKEQVMSRPDVGTDLKIIEQDKSSQKVLSLVGQLAHFENRVSTQNPNSPTSVARMKFQNHQINIDNEFGTPYVQQRHDTADFNTIMSSKDKFPLIKGNLQQVRFAQDTIQGPKHLRNLTHTNFNQLDKFNQFKLLGVEYSDRRINQVQKRAIRTREETSNTVIQNQYPIMVSRVTRTLRTPKNTRVKIRLNKSIEKEKYGTNVEPEEVSLLKPIHIRKLNTRDRTPLVLGAAENGKSRRDTEKTFADHERYINRKNPFDSSFSNAQNKNTNQRKKEGADLFDLMDESMSGPSTDQNTFRGNMRGQGKFVFGQNVENITTSKHKREMDQSKAQQNASQAAASNPTKIFVEPNISFNLKNRTKNNKSYGLQSNKPRWQTPINQFPSTEFNTTKMSIKSSYENYADQFIKMRTSKEGQLKLDHNIQHRATGINKNPKFDLKIGIDGGDSRNDSTSDGKRLRSIENNYTHRLTNPNHRAKIQDIVRNISNDETINHIAGKMKDQPKAQNANYPLDKQLNMSARSRIKLMDQIQQFRQESGRFGGNQNNDGYYSHQKITDKNKISERNPANSTERIKDSITFEVSPSGQTSSSLPKFRNMANEKTDATHGNQEVTDYTPQSVDAKQNGFKDGAGSAMTKKVTHNMTETSYERASEVISRPRSIKMDELGVHSVKSREKKMSQDRSFDNMKVQSKADLAKQAKKVVIKQVYNRFHQNDPDSNKRKIEGRRMHSNQQNNNKHGYTTVSHKKSPLRGNSLFTSNYMSSTQTERHVQFTSRPEENFFKNIENNPHIPLKQELEMQEQIRTVQKKLRQRAEELKAIKKENLQSQEAMGELYQQNQKLKDLFMQMYGINLGSDFVSEPTEKMMASQSDGRKSTTFGESNLKLHSTLNTAKSPNEDQKLETILSDAKDTNNSRQEPMITPGRGDTQGFKEFSPTPSEIQKQNEIRERQESLLQVSEYMQPKSTKIQGILSKGNSKSYIISGTNSQENIDNNGAVTQDRIKIQIVDKGREESLKKNGMVEHQIFNLYHHTINNTLQRQKQQTTTHLSQIKNKMQTENQDLQDLQNQNTHLKKVMARYRTYILNFKTEWKNEYLEQIKKNRTLAEVLKQRDKSPQRISTFKVNVDSQPRGSSKLQQKGNIAIAEGAVAPSQTQDLTQNDVPPYVEKLTGELDLVDTTNEDVNESPNIKVSSLCKPLSPLKTLDKRLEIDKQVTIELQQTSPLNVGNYLQTQKTEDPTTPIRSPNLKQPSLFSVAALSEKSAINDKIDNEKIQNFCSKIKNTCKLDKPFDLVLTLIDNIKQFIGCHKVMIVPIDPYFVQILTSKQQNSKERLSLIHNLDFLDKGSGLNKKLICISKSEEEKANTLIIDSVTQYTEKEIFIEGNQVAILLWHNKQELTPFMAIQFEMPGGDNHGDKSSKQISKRPSMMSHSHSPSRQHKHVREKKMNRLELLFLHLIGQGIQIKLESLLSIQKMRDDRLVLEQSVDMVKEIMLCDTLRGLARKMNVMLKEYLHFDTINIMFKDPEKPNLYTITFGDEDEQRQQVQEMLKRCKTEAERQAILDKQSIKDFVLRGNNMIIFPLHAGITSLVYYQQKPIVINNFLPTSHFDFVNEIDNPKAIKNIDNLLIGRLKREDGSTNGIVQLFNQNKNISAYDRRRFTALSGFFGGCIEKIEDKTRKLTTVMAAKMNYELARAQVLECYDAVANEGTIESYVHLKKPFDFMDMEIKRDQEDIYGKDGHPPTPMLNSGRNSGVP